MKNTMKKIQYSSMLLLVALVLVACQSIDPGASSASSRFVDQSQIEGLYLDGRTVLVRNDNAHQTSIRHNAYRIQTDDQSIYVNFLFDQIPTQINGTCTMTIDLYGLTQLKSGPYQMVLREITNEKLWFWNEENKMGVIVPKL